VLEGTIDGSKDSDGKLEGALDGARVGHVVLREFMAKSTHESYKLSPVSAMASFMVLMTPLVCACPCEVKRVVKPYASNLGYGAPPTDGILLSM